MHYRTLFVPYPHAVDDHQTKNAEFLEQAGAAHIAQQVELDGPSLSKKLVDLIGDRNKLESMAVKARALAKPQATQAVVNNLMEVCYA